MNIKQYLIERKRLVDKFLKEYIASKKKTIECPKSLANAMGYALMAGGKRIRPIICLASHEAAGGRPNKILPVAASLELIHTYSLIHDDLPAMDDDDFRRNKPTTHRIYGEAIAILAGDALLTDAFNIISGFKAKPEMLLRTVYELTIACGPEGMVGGQTADLIFEGKKASRKDLLYIHSHKTGAFLKAAVRIGAIMANASRSELNALSKYGEKVGLAFQVIDDILDITGTKEELGKTIGADNARGKNTYPSIYGLEKSRQIAEQLIHESLDFIKKLGKKADPLREIATFILSRKN